MDEVVAHAGPVEARPLITDVVRHCRGPRGEDRQIGATLALQFELSVLQAFADLVVTDGDPDRRNSEPRVLQPRDLRVTEFLKVAGRRGVVAVTVNDHGIGTRSRQVEGARGSRAGGSA